MPNLDLAARALSPDPLAPVKLLTGLDPLAPFKLLAVMCHPDAPFLRQRMMAHLHRETGHGTARQRGLAPDTFLRQVDKHARRGGLAGSLVLTVLQLRFNDLPATLDAAMAIVVPRLPRWVQPNGSEWHKDIGDQHTPHSRPKVLKAFHAYRRVAHLWAAYVHAQEHGRTDISPSTNATLPRFLAYADAFAGLAATTRWLGGDGPLLLQPAKLWTFAIPPLLQEVRPVIALPLHPEQQQLYDTHLAAKALI